MSKIYMTVMNTLITDARVQRAATSLQQENHVVVIGIDKGCGEQPFEQIVLQLYGQNNIIKYFEYFFKCKSILKNADFQIYYAHDYFSAALVPWVKKHKADVKVVYDAHELIIPNAGLSLSRRDNFFYRNESSAVKVADLIICASDERAKMMQEHYKLNVTPTVIENISELPINDDDFERDVLDRCMSVLSAGEPILVYAGVLSESRRIDKLIEVICQRKKGRLLIIGDGPDSDRLKTIAKNKIEGRYYFTGGLPYKYMGGILQKCDVGYISYPVNSLNNMFCAPNKIYEYASVGLPMIAPYNPTIKRFFDDYGIGVIDEDIGKAFDIVSANLIKYKDNCITFCKEHPWEKTSQKLIKTINALV